MNPETQKRLDNLQRIIKWSIKQVGDEPSSHPDSTSEYKPMDVETRKWLQEALTSISNAPSETDLLKAALAVLKSHLPSVKSGSLNDGDKQALLTATEDTLYFIEDLDHANDLIPLGGVEVIRSLVSHPDSDCRRAACGLIGTACQNNPKMQSTFLPSLSVLFQIVCNEADEKETRVKALFAISSLVRENQVTTAEFFKMDGVGLLTTCIRSHVDKLRIKSLFLLRSITQPLLETAGSSWYKNLLQAVMDAVKHCGEGEVREMATSTLSVLVRSSKDIVTICREDGELMKVLTERTREMAEENDEQEYCRRLLNALTLN